LCKEKDVPGLRDPAGLSFYSSGSYRPANCGPRRRFLKAAKRHYRCPHRARSVYQFCRNVECQPSDHGCVCRAAIRRDCFHIVFGGDFVRVHENLYVLAIDLNYPSLRTQVRLRDGVGWFHGCPRRTQGFDQAGAVAFGAVRAAIDGDGETVAEAVPPRPGTS